MNNISLTKNIVSKANLSLPLIIKLVQVDPTHNRSTSFEDATDAGNLGDGIFPFSIDCKHKCIDNPEREEDGFKMLNSVFGNYLAPQIHRDIIFNSFYIVEIPDYSHEALSNGFVDFVVYVYDKNGAKIPQRYIGLLKCYTNKTCYVLIDKSIRNNVSFGAIESTDTLNIVIKFKKNYEYQITSAKTLSTTSPKNLTSEYTNKFDFSLTNNSSININNENYLYPNYLTENNVAKKLSKQSYKSNKNDANKKYDYFATIFELDYDLDNTIKPSLEKDTAADARVTLGSNDIKSIYSNHDAYEFLESDESVKSGLDNYYYFSYPEDFSVFSSNGKLLTPYRDYQINYNSTNKQITSIARSSSGSYEIIPEFSSIRKIKIFFTVKNNASITLNEESIRSILYKQKIFRYNKCFINSNTTQLYINGNYKSIGTSALANDVVAIFIYDNLENISSNPSIDTSINDSITVVAENVSLSYIDNTNPFNLSYNNLANEITNDDNFRLYKDDYTGAYYYKNTDGNYQLYKYSNNGPDGYRLEVDNYKTRMGLIWDELNGYSNGLNGTREFMNSKIEELSKRFSNFARNSSDSNISLGNPSKDISIYPTTLFVIITKDGNPETLTLKLTETSKAGNSVDIVLKKLPSKNGYWYILPIFWNFKTSSCANGSLYNKYSISSTENIRYCAFGG